MNLDTADNRIVNVILSACGGEEGGKKKKKKGDLSVDVIGVNGGEG